MASSQKSVLFVCLGNICRSPIAEAVFRHMVTEKGLADQWLIDSCGLENWHFGDKPDDRALDCLKRNGVPTDHTARKVTKDDFKKFDTIFGMDDENIRCLKRVQPKEGKAVVKLLGSYDPQKQLIIHDPYYGEEKDFETVFNQCSRCCEAFLEEQSK